MDRGTLILVLVLAGVLFVIVLLAVLVPRLTGWRRLAEEFAADACPQPALVQTLIGTRWGGTPVNVSPLAEVMQACLCEKGLFVRGALLAPSVFVPWRELVLKEPKVLFGRYAALRWRGAKRLDLCFRWEFMPLLQRIMSEARFDPSFSRFAPHSQ